MSIKLVSRNSLTTEVAELIRARILEERLEPDAALGTEAELAKQYDVSRAVIREAVSQLRGLGLVRSRQGKGLCVASSSAAEIVSKAFIPSASSSDFSQLCHIRFILEVGALPLAVKRATEEQIERMRFLAEEMREFPEISGPKRKELAEDFAKREIEFHQLIFAAADCEFGTQLHSVLIEYFFEAFINRPKRAWPSRKDVDDHVKLVEAFAVRDIPEAVAIMVSHLQNMFAL